MKLLRSLLLLAVAPVAAGAQGVLIAPHAVFIDHRARSGSFEIYNPSSEQVEVTISTIYGHPVTDSIGEFEVVTQEHPDPSAPSAASWIEAFPRRIRLAPQERQTVRLLGSPPASLPDGEYWTRVVVEAAGARIPVTGDIDTTRVSVGVTLSVRTLVALMYRKGPVTSGVTLDRVRAVVEGDSLAVRARIVRSGNAAYLGTLRIAVSDSLRREVASTATLIAAYTALEPRFALPIDSLPAGRYTVRVQIDTRRDDLPGAPILRSDPVSATTEFVLRGRAP